MKKLLLFASALMMSTGLFAQFVDLEVEEYQVHTGPTTDGVDLTGFTTYRLYITLTSPTDFVSAIFSEPDKPCKIETSTAFYQSPFGGTVGPDVNPAFFPTFPSLEWDSWVTIGRASNAEPGGAINIIQSSTDPWITDFNAGNSIIMDGLYGGSWFALNGDVNGVAGADLKVLIGQFTTDGDFHGVITCQIFPLGVGANSQFTISYPFSSNPNAVFGCTDPAATNYDPAADTDDSSCIFPCALALESVTVNANPCPGGNTASIAVNVTGGQGSVGFQLNGGNVQLSNVFANLSANTYALTVTDSQGCSFTEDVVVADPAPIAFAPTVTPITCNGDANAVLNGTATGGTGDIMYGLAPGTLDNSTGVFENLGPGNYTVYAMDENGCTANSGSINIANPAAVNIVAVIPAAATCFNSEDGMLNVTANGGTGMLSYSANGTDFQGSNMISVVPGTYTVSVMDENGCVDVANFPVTVNGGPVITADTDATDALCADSADGMITVTADGGNGGFTYSIDGGEFVAENMFGGLAAGSYMITVMDMEGCELMTETEVGAPDAIMLDATVTDASCNGLTDGMVSLAATGGNGGYMFDFNEGGLSMDTDYMDLAPGTYSVMIEDTEGCSAMAEVEVAEPSVVEASAEGTDALCNGDENGMVDASATGGTGDYTYSIDGENFGDSGSFGDLGAGDYTITVMDANGCMAEASASVAEPDAIEMTSDVTIDSGAGDGAIDITITGGTGSYEVSWSGPDGFSADTEDISGLGAGNYDVTITDDNGCEYTETIVLTVGLDELFSDLSVAVMPNPSNGEFVLNIDGMNGERILMTITDGIGRTVISEQINGSGLVRTDINLNNAADGMYFLNLTVGQASRTIKLIKQ